MSKFFARVSDSDFESSSEEEVPIVPEKKRTATVPKDDSDIKRVVRTAADKQKKELELIINNIKNLKKIKDFSNLLNAFGELLKVFEKYDNEKEKDGSIAFFQCLADVNEFVAEVWRDRQFRDNMTKAASKSLVSLRQKVKKFVKIFANQVSNISQGQDAIEEHQEVHIDESLKNDIDSDEDCKDSTDDWGGTDDSDSSDDGCLNETREYYLKKTLTTMATEKVKTDRKRTKKVDGLKEHEEKGWQTINNLGYSIEYQSFLKDEVSVSSLAKFLVVLNVTKNKRLSSSRQKEKLLSDLLDLAQSKNLGLPLMVKIQLSLASASFDCNLNHVSAMKLDYWEQTLNYMFALASSLQEVDFDISPDIDEEKFENSPFAIRACVVSLVEKLDEEFYKILKDCDPYGDAYINSLRDEVKITDIIDRVYHYVHRRGTVSAQCQINMMKIGHFYYKLDKNIQEKTEGMLPSIAEMDRLCKFVYVHDSSNILRTRAILSQIYHFALHDYWIEARDLMLMSHLQECIQHSDPRTQIMFNRAMTQLGLCAFRVGRISDAHSCLADLLASGRPKELLGQGFLQFRMVERTREQELRERQFQIPFHMHIPLELVEFVYLVSAMIIDIPYLSMQDSRRRIISKPLYQMLRMIDRQCLVGPPETLREHIAAACRSLRLGQWQACYNFLVNPKMTIKVWSKLQKPTPVMKMLEETIKSAALLTYVLSFASVYDSLNITELSETFDLAEKRVMQRLAGIIDEEELSAALDEPTGTLVPQLNRHIYLHSLSHQLIERVTALLENNERLCRFGQKPTGFEVKAHHA